MDESTLEGEKETTDNKPQADNVVLPLSTDGFLTLAKELSADVDLPSFFTQWVHDTFIPSALAVLPLQHQEEEHDGGRRAAPMPSATTSSSTRVVRP